LNSLKYHIFSKIYLENLAASGSHIMDIKYGFIYEIFS
jgi:hypothetical protein